MADIMKSYEEIENLEAQIRELEETINTDMHTLDELRNKLNEIKGSGSNYIKLYKDSIKAKYAPIIFAASEYKPDIYYYSRSLWDGKMKRYYSQYGSYHYPLWTGLCLSTVIFGIYTLLLIHYRYFDVSNWMFFLPFFIIMPYFIFRSVYIWRKEKKARNVFEKAMKEGMEKYRLQRSAFKEIIMEIVETLPPKQQKRALDMVEYYFKYY